jgi:NTP pyrophosphatase (non-canonical NTP hydrolase)
MSLNELRDKVFAYVEKQGFHERTMNLGERLMLVVSELSEALDADRQDCWAKKELIGKAGCYYLSGVVPENIKEFYLENVKGTVEEELADTIMRICDIAGVYGIDLDWHVAAKMAYNETRPHLHGKKYG